MHILVLNSGSSSLKFRLFTVDDTTSDGAPETLRPLLGGSSSA
jgi:acetate kinase